MKIGFMLLPFVCVAGVAVADGMDKDAADQMPAVAGSSKAPAHYRMEKNQQIRLPGGDLRDCLKLKSNKDVIRCSETRRKK